MRDYLKNKPVLAWIIFLVLFVLGYPVASYLFDQYLWFFQREYGWLW
jgi:hypothetical protein